MLNGTSPDGCACYFLIDLFCNENFVHCFISRLLQSSRKHSSWPSSSRVVRHRFRLPPARRRLQLPARLRLRSLRQQLWLVLPPCPTQQFWWGSACTSLHTWELFFLQNPWVRVSGKLTHGFCRTDFWCLVLWCRSRAVGEQAQHTDTLVFHLGNKKFQFLFYEEVEPLPPCLVAFKYHRHTAAYCTPKSESQIPSDLQNFQSTIEQSRASILLLSTWKKSNFNLIYIFVHLFSHFRDLQWMLHRSTCHLHLLLVHQDHFTRVAHHSQYHRMPWRWCRLSGFWVALCFTAKSPRPTAIHLPHHLFCLLFQVEVAQGKCPDH